MHGSIEWSRCPVCGTRVELERVVEMLEAAGGAPECPACVTPLKPEVVLFGEMLPMEAIARAEQLAAGADLMICIGSSLVVHPVAGLPEMTLAAGGQAGRDHRQRDAVRRPRRRPDGRRRGRRDGVRAGRSVREP